MSILDLHADEQVQASLNTAPSPVAPPAKFSAWSAIPRAIGVAAGEVGASAADLVNAARVFRDTPSREIAASGLPTSAFSSELGDTVRKYLDDFRPDPNTASTAEQVLFGFSRGLAKVVPATIVAGPVGAIVAGIEEGMTVSDELRRKGVGADARTKAGMIQGAGLASAALPLLGTTLAETAALYVAGGPGGFMAQQALTREILRDAGHDQIAAGYDPFDPVGLAVASLIPAGFTAYGLRGQVKAARAKAAADFNAGPVPSEPTPVAAAVADAYKPAPPRIPPEVVDAAMVQNTRDFAAAQTPAVVAHAEDELHAGAELGERHLVDLDDPVEATQVERRDAVAAVAGALDATDHGRAAAEGDDGDPMLGADLEDLLDLGGRAGVDDGVRGVRAVTAPDPDEVGEALAAGVLDAGNFAGSAQSAQGTYTLGAWTSLRWQRTGGNVSLGQDAGMGSLTSVASGATTVTGAICVGNGAVGYLTGRVTDVIICSAALTAPELAIIRSYLTARGLP